MAVRIGELLLKEKRITPEQLQEALNYQRTHGGRLAVTLVRLGFVTDEEITALLSAQYGVPAVALASFEFDPRVVKLLPAETARRYQLIPLSRSGATLTIAMSDPTNVFAIDDVKFMTGYNVEPMVASEQEIWADIERLDFVPEGDVNVSHRRPYEAIFVSYSHKDGAVVTALERAYEVLGLHYIRDVRELRSGQQWSDELLGKIDDADVFQLCWSNAAAASQYVEREWRHALGLHRAEFVRPVFWETPMPPPPSELAPLHFARLEWIHS